MVVDFSVALLEGFDTAFHDFTDGLAHRNFLQPAGTIFRDAPLVNFERQHPFGIAMHHYIGVMRDYYDLPPSFVFTELLYD